MAEASDFENVFSQLKGILEPYASQLIVTADTAGNYSLDTQHVMENKQRLFFGAAQIKKAYVSFYLMPVYVFPDLLETISPALKKRMQGKSCFNFKRIDPGLLAELAELTAAGFERYQAEALL